MSYRISVGFDRLAHTSRETYRDRSARARIRIAERVTQPLHLVRIEANVVLDDNATMHQQRLSSVLRISNPLMSRSGRSLQPRVRLKVEVECEWMADASIDNET